MLNFDKESIKVVKGDSTGAIKVNGTLTIVGLTDEFFKIILILLIFHFIQIWRKLTAMTKTKTL